MTTEQAQKLKAIQKRGILGTPEKAYLWELYTEVFGRAPEGSPTCGNCVNTAFWKLIPHIDSFLAQPPVAQPENKETPKKKK